MTGWWVHRVPKHKYAALLTVKLPTENVVSVHPSCPVQLKHAAELLAGFTRWQPTAGMELAMAKKAFCMTGPELWSSEVRRRGRYSGGAQQRDFDCAVLLERGAVYGGAQAAAVKVEFSNSDKSLWINSLQILWKYLSNNSIWATKSNNWTKKKFKKQKAGIVWCQK